MKKWPIIIIMLLLTVCIGASAQTQITLGGSDSGQTISFTSPGANQAISMSFSGSCTVPGAGGESSCMSGSGALHNPPAADAGGSYYMWMTGGGPSLNQLSAGNYSVNMNSSTFNYLWSAQNGTVAGNITLTGAAQVPGYSQVFFVGRLNVTSSTGVYSSLFPAGSNNMDVTFYLNSGTVSLDTLWAQGGTSTGILSSGELVPVVPEPASLALLGSGMLAAGSLFKFRRRK
jgi:hypothetical protein